MKLPRGAFTMGRRSALVLDAESDGTVTLTSFRADPVDLGTYGDGPYDLINGWRPIDGFVLPRRRARVLLRRLLAAIERAEALQHAAKLIREGHQG